MNLKNQECSRGSQEEVRFVESSRPLQKSLIDTIQNTIQIPSYVLCQKTAERNNNYPEAARPLFGRCGTLPGVRC